MSSSRRPSSHGSSGHQNHHDADRDYMPTFGTYYWHEISRPTSGNCTCACCPHSYAGATRASQCDGYDDDEPRPRGPHAQDRHPREYDAAHTGPRRTRRTFTIPVKNRTNGSLRRRHGKMFPLHISHDTTTGDILTFLAPDSSRHKVVVHWDDNTYETLEDWISVREVCKYATYLEVKGRKRVQFA